MMCNLLPPPVLHPATDPLPPARPDTGSVARAGRTVAVEPGTTATDQVRANMKGPLLSEGNHQIDETSLMP